MLAVYKWKSDPAAVSYHFLEGARKSNSTVKPLFVAQGSVETPNVHPRNTIGLNYSKSDFYS